MVGDIVLRLRSLDMAKRSFRRSALRYSARIARGLGYVDAAMALEYTAAGIAYGAVPPALEAFP